MTGKTKTWVGIAGIAIGLGLVALALLHFTKEEDQAANRGSLILAALCGLAGVGALIGGLRGRAGASEHEALFDPLRPMAPPAPSAKSPAAANNDNRTIGPGFTMDYSEILIKRGNDRAAKKDFDGAIVDYTEVLKVKPDNHEVYRNCGSARLFKGDLEGALADYTEAIRIKPEYVDAYLNRGNARGRAGDRDGAIADLEQVVALAPESPAAKRAREAIERLKQGTA